MIISHKYKFIFIKTKRTAGTSIELALSGICGEEDIITPVGPKDEIIRKQLGVQGPQNYMVPLRSYNLIDWIKLLFGNKKRFNAHMSAKRIKKIIGKKTWDDYFKFCVVRNPWDRTVSLYYLHNKSNPHRTISEYIRSGAPFRSRVNNMRLFMIDNKIAVDKVCSYENIDNEFYEIARNLGFPENISLPSGSSRPRADRRNYRQILSIEDSEIILRNCSDEIKMFNYSY